MNDLSQSVQAASQPYLEALQQIKDLDVAKGNLGHKQTLLRREIEAIEDHLATLERERPELLEAVLNGSRSEQDIVDRQAEAERLKAEGRAKQDLLILVETQIQTKVQSRVNLNARLEPLRRRIFAAIEEDLVASMPNEFIPYVTKLMAISGGNSRDGLMVIKERLGEHNSAWWAEQREKILSEYGVSH